MDGWVDYLVGELMIDLFVEVGLLVCSVLKISLGLHIEN